MELLKQIKEAETQTQQIIDRAKADASAASDEARKKRQASVVEAEQQRRKAIESATDAAKAQGLAEAQNLKEQAKKTRQQLWQKAEGKIPTAAEKVVGYLKG